jgi:hypothetical protein
MWGKARSYPHNDYDEDLQQKKPYVFLLPDGARRHRPPAISIYATYGIAVTNG